MYIYSITNKINGKQYIGQTTKNIQQRWKKHQKDALVVCRPYPLHNAIRKYGIENFEIEEIVKVDNLEDLNNMEVEAIKIFMTLVPNGYNLQSGGKNKLHHQNTKQKLSLLAKGRMHSNETKAIISKTHTGKVNSEKTKLKMSKSKSGENAYNSKLTIEEARYIKNSNKRVRDLALEFSQINQSVISNIRLGKSWKYI